MDTQIFPEHKLVKEDGHIYLQCGKYGDVRVELPYKKGEMPLPVEQMVKCVVFRDFRLGIISGGLAAKALGLNRLDFREEYQEWFLEQAARPFVKGWQKVHVRVTAGSAMTRCGKVIIRKNPGVNLRHAHGWCQACNCESELKKLRW